MAAEEELARLLTGGSYVTVDRLSGLLRHLEPDRLAGLLLANGCPIDSVTVRSNVLDPHADDVAASELALSRKRVLRHAAIVGRENVIAGTDCGLGSRVHADLTWAKLRTLLEGARLASMSLWP